MPTRSAISFNPVLRTFDQRLQAGQSGVCAALRQLIHRAFALRQSGQPFDPHDGLASRVARRSLPGWLGGPPSCRAGGWERGPLCPLPGDRGILAHDSTRFALGTMTPRARMLVTPGVRARTPALPGEGARSGRSFLPDRTCPESPSRRAARRMGRAERNPSVT
jgi:hypothetical protein